MEIYYAVNEIGDGHAFRASKVAERLIERGHTVTFFTSHPTIKERFDDRCDICECAPLWWYEDRNGINDILSILNVFVPLPAYDYEKNLMCPEMYLKKSVFSQVMARYYDIRNYANEKKPDKVLTEGDPIMARWALRRDIETIGIANHTRPYYTFWQKLILHPLQWFIERNYIRKTKIIVPDFKMPYTICEYNLRGVIGERDDLEFVGPYVQGDGTPHDEDLIYFSINGPYGTRTKLEKKFLPVLENFVEKTGYELIVSLGNPRRKEEHYGSIKKYGWLSNDERKRCMRDAHIIIHSGSHNTTMETVVNGKVSMCIPTQPEQRGQAKKIEWLGCGKAVEKPRKLIAALREIEDDYDFYKTNAEELMHLASGMNGVERTVKIIEGEY